jgi:DNA-binding cell septation regulator SpoVG
MPNVKQTDGTFREVAYPANDRTLKCIQEAVIAEYEKVIGPKPEADDEHGYLPSSPMSSL